MTGQLKNPRVAGGPGTKQGGGPPKPAANQNQKKRENLETMLKGGIAQRMVRHAGPKFGVRTGHVHKGNHKQPSVRGLSRCCRKFRLAGGCDSALQNRSRQPPTTSRQTTRLGGRPPKRSLTSSATS